jgi:hypothetical protein
MGVLKPVGRATAISRGHYPLADGRHKVMSPGEVFTVWEGQAKAKWFTLQPVEVKAVAPAPAEPETLAGAAKVERKRKAETKPPTGDDIV